MSGILDVYIYAYPIPISFVHRRKRKSYLRFCPSSPTRRKKKIFKPQEDFQCLVMLFKKQIKL